MRIVRTVEEMRAWRAEVGRQGCSIAMVHTKGCLHAGHLALLRQAKMECDFVVAVIFLSPAEFPTAQAFEDFPRSEQHDIDRLRSTGYTDILFCPPASEFTGTDGSMTGAVISYRGGLADLFEVRRRPEKFDGLCTTVIKMIGIVQPDCLYVGRDCVQRERLLRQLLRELLVPVEVVAVPLVRGPDGVVLDSRLVRLTREELDLARLILPTLLAIIQRYMKGDHDVPVILRDARNDLERPGLKIDYMAIVEEETFKEISRLDPIKGGLLIIGVTINDRPFVDNVTLAPCPKLPFFKRIFRHRNKS